MFDVWKELISIQFQSNECMEADWTNIMVYDNLDPTPELFPTPESKPALRGKFSSGLGQLYR